MGRRQGGYEGSPRRWGLAAEGWGSSAGRRHGQAGLGLPQPRAPLSSRVSGRFLPSLGCGGRGGGSSKLFQMENDGIFLESGVSQALVGIADEGKPEPCGLAGGPAAGAQRRLSVTEPREAITALWRACCLWAAGEAEELVARLALVMVPHCPAPTQQPE